MTLRRILAVLAFTLWTGTAVLAASVDELGKVDFANSCAMPFSRNFSAPWPAAFLLVGPGRARLR
jgi:hypothetical protein